MTKISILFFYLRIFPKRHIRIAAYVVMGLNVAFLLVFVLITVFQCTPLEGAWRHWDSPHEYTCRNINAQAWGAAAGNLVLDLMTMGLPLRELYRLNLSLRKKISVMAMFCIGSL
jgi:hypothetical protein